MVTHRTYACRAVTYVILIQFNSRVPGRLIQTDPDGHNKRSQSIAAATSINSNSVLKPVKVEEVIFTAHVRQYRKRC